MNRTRPTLLLAVLAVALLGAGPPTLPSTPPAASPARMNSGVAVAPTDVEVRPQPAAAPVVGLLPGSEDLRGLRNTALLMVGSLLPVVALMFTPFVRIHITLILLRQALGSPQVPGNQVLMALAFMLTVLVVRPLGETVYKGAIAPYAGHQMTAEDARDAWEAGSRPIKNFMVDQIERTGHTNYLYTLHDYADPPREGRVLPAYNDEFPLQVVAPAYLLSELTTALWIGFMIYLPFLVVDLVVSAVLSAMGLFMLPPTLVAMPLKLILFVLADGWLLVATSLLQTFAV